MSKFRRTTLITAGCLAALAGLGLARKFQFEPSSWLLVLWPALLLLKRRNLTSLILVILLGLGLGLWRGGIYVQKYSQLSQLTGQKVTILASATSDSVYSSKGQIEFTANHAKLANRQLAGSFKISGFGTPMVYRGDIVEIEGKLFPTRGANQARIAYAKLEVVASDSNPINQFTRRFSAGLQSALPEPNASFGAGLLIGQRNNLPTELTNQMIMVGLVHIVAVSGYNLTILVRAAEKLRMRSKYQQLILSLALIGFFLLMTGFVASVVRAAIVSVLSLWAWFYGRKIRPILILSFTAALTALVNPFYIWGDLGWYLSFLAFFGILMISPIIVKKFRRQPKLLGIVAIETICAEIMALPFIMMMFGQLSIIGLLANLLVVPLVPIAMLLAAVAAFAGMLVPAFAGWLAWPASLLLTYMLDIVRLLSQVPGIFLRRSISLPETLVFYAAVFLFILAINKRHKVKISLTELQNTRSTAIIKA